MPTRELPEARLSIRLLWPFVRVTGVDPEGVSMLAKEGIGPLELANPDTRVRHATIMKLLASAISRTRDPALGIKAGERFEAGDLNPLNFAARSCATLREAILCSARYMHLANEAARVTLDEEGDLAVWRWQIIDGVEQLPAANDFVMVCASRFSELHAGPVNPLLEVHFMHESPTDTAAYQRVFGDAKLKLGMPHNALVVPRSGLDLPMSQANAGVHAAFELYAQEVSKRVQPGDVSGKVRDLVIAHLRGGELSMEAIARRLAMSVATLRRRLEHEGTTHSDIVDAVRKDLARRYLGDQQLAITEVAFLLGYSNVTAFHKAFKRWMAMTPAEFRARGS